MEIDKDTFGLTIQHKSTRVKFNWIDALMNLPASLEEIKLIYTDMGDIEA